jgi:hypothetical protein
VTLIGARHWRVEVHLCSCGKHHVVTVEPVVFVGKAEFKNFAAAFRRLFMNLHHKWCWIRYFKSHTEAQVFGKSLVKFLGEVAYVEEGEICLVTPAESLERSF